jgi:glutaredoxin
MLFRASTMEIFPRKKGFKPMKKISPELQETIDLLKEEMEQLEKWAKRAGGSIKPPIVNLTYIALSRSKASTIVAIDDSEESEIEPFLMDMLGYATELAIKQGDK